MSRFIGKKRVSWAHPPRSNPLPETLAPTSKRKAVDRKTKDVLVTTSEAMKHVRNCLIGPGNIPQVVAATRGRSFHAARACNAASYSGHRRPKTPRSSIARQATVALRSGGGVCDDYAVALAAELNRRLDINTLIHICRTQPQHADNISMAHVLVVVGDLDRPSDCIVADAWSPTAPTMLLADSVYAGTLEAKISFFADHTELCSKRLDKVTLPTRPISLAKEAPLWAWLDGPIERDGVPVEYVVDDALEHSKAFEFPCFLRSGDPRRTLTRWRGQSFAPRRAYQGYFTQYKDRVFRAKFTGAEAQQRVTIDVFRCIDGQFYQVPWGEVGMGNDQYSLVLAREMFHGVFRHLETCGRLEVAVLEAVEKAVEEAARVQLQASARLTHRPAKTTVQAPNRFRRRREKTLKAPQRL